MLMNFTLKEQIRCHALQYSFVLSSLVKFFIQISLNSNKDRSASKCTQQMCTELGCKHQLHCAEIIEQKSWKGNGLGFYGNK